MMAFSPELIPMRMAQLTPVKVHCRLPTRERNESGDVQNVARQMVKLVAMQGDKSIGCDMTHDSSVKVNDEKRLKTPRRRSGSSEEMSPPVTANEESGIKPKK